MLGLTLGEMTGVTKIILPSKCVVLILICFLGLTGCATQETGRQAEVPIFATAGNYVFAGCSRSWSTSGAFQFRSLTGYPPIECSGQYVDRAALLAEFTCSNGVTGSIHINPETKLTGSGSGESLLGPIELVFGYSVNSVNRRLKLPPGKKLIRNQYGNVALINID